jgi:hypothetical protein
MTFLITIRSPGSRSGPAHYREYAQADGPGAIAWDGRLLYGWSVGDVIAFSREDSRD